MLTLYNFFSYFGFYHFNFLNAKFLEPLYFMMAYPVIGNRTFNLFTVNNTKFSNK